MSFSSAKFRSLFSVPFLLLLPLLWISGCSTSGSKGKTKDTFRVMTYNIHHGEGIDGRIDLQRIADVIKREGADIVALQEVDRGVLRSGKRDLANELAALTGMSAYFDNNLNYQGGEYGNAVLTRFPILQATNTHYKMLEPKEQRGAIQLMLWVNNRRLLFMNTHLDFRETPEGAQERLMHVETMRNLIKSYGPAPVIVCGDFNSSPNSETHVAMKKFMRDSWEVAGHGSGLTIPVQNPEKRIDYIWVSGPVKPEKVWVPKTDASDHLPVVGEFRLKALP